MGRPPGAGRRTSAGDSDLDDEDDDVLELTEIVAEPDPPGARGRLTAKAPTTAGPPSPLPGHAGEPTMTVQSAEPLISPVAASASTNAFARLAKAAAPEDKKMSTSPGSPSSSWSWTS